MCGSKSWLSLWSSLHMELVNMNWWTSDMHDSEVRFESCGQINFKSILVFYRFCPICLKLSLFSKKHISFPHSSSPFPLTKLYPTKPTQSKLPDWNRPNSSNSKPPHQPKIRVQWEILAQVSVQTLKRKHILAAHEEENISIDENIKC